MKFGPTATSGGLVEIAIWRNESDAGPFYSVSVQRSFEVENEWKRTSTLTKHDLLPVAVMLQQAWSWICEQQSRDRKEE